jgi:hypothetical protein
MAKKPKKQQPLSDNTVFEMLIRIDNDKRLRKAISARLLWLLWVMSKQWGYAVISERALTLSLRAKPWQIEQSIHRICHKWGFFSHKKTGPGVHRPWRFTPRKRKGETDLEFELRMLAARCVDSVIRLHWEACDQTAETGTAQFACTELNMSGDTLRRARNEMNRLGHFKVDSDEKSGRPSTYTRVQPTELQRHRMEQLIALIRDQGKAEPPARIDPEPKQARPTQPKPVKQAKPKQPHVWSEQALKQRQLDYRFRREQENQAEAARLNVRLADEAGFGRTTGITAAKLEKLTANKTIQPAGYRLFGRRPETDKPDGDKQ